MIIIDFHIVLDRGSEALARAEAGGGRNFADAAVEALYHNAGLWVTPFDQAMPFRAAHIRIEGVVICRLFVFGRESVRELAGVVGP